MCTPGSGVFIELEGCSERRLLHPATILGSGGDRCEVELRGTDNVPSNGESIRILWEADGDFVQQEAVVESTVEESPSTFVNLRFQGALQSANRRQSYRTSVVHEELTVRIGGDEACRLLDVSPTGFSAVSPERYGVGNIVAATVRFDGDEFTGMACIKNAYEFDGRYRYGFYCSHNKALRGTLGRGLLAIGIAVQDTQLHRLRDAP